MLNRNSSDAQRKNHRNCHPQTKSTDQSDAKTPDIRPDVVPTTKVLWINPLRLQ